MATLLLSGSLGLWPLKARPFLEQRHCASHACGGTGEYEIYGGREFAP